MTILSVAVVAAIQGFAQGLRLLRLAGEHQHAALLADQKAREVITPVEGREEGQDQESNDTFTWERTTTVVPFPGFADQPSAAEWRVYRIDVHVRWGGRHDVEVATLRTMPVNAASQAGSTAPSPGMQPASPSQPSRGTQPILR